MSDESSTCTCHTHPELHCLRHPGLSETRIPLISRLFETVPSELTEPPAITHLRKVLKMSQIPTGVIVAAARDVIGAYDLELARLRAIGREGDN